MRIVGISTLRKKEKCQMSTENTTNNSRPLPVSRGGTGRTNLVGANSLRSDMGLGTEAGAVTSATIGLPSPTATPGDNTYMPWLTGALPSTNLDELTNPGFYRIAETVSNAPMDLPSWNGGTGSAILQVMPILHANLIQVLYHANGQIWRRTRQDSEWGMWARTDSGELPVNNLTSTSTTAPLSANQGRVLNEGKANVSHEHNSEEVGLPTPTSASTANTYMPWLPATLPSNDLKQITSPGFYQITVAVTNAPPGMTGNAGADSAMLLVMPISALNMIQIMYRANGQVWRRTKRNSEWEAWELPDEDGGEPPVDDLTSTSTTAPLSANQGRLLSETKQPRLEAGANITITDNGNGTQTISSTGGSGGSADLSGVQTQLDGHIGDTTAHVTANERNNWNGTQTNLNAHTQDTTIHMQAPTSTSNANSYMPWSPGALPNPDLNNVRNPGFYRLVVDGIANRPPGLPTFNTGDNSATLQVMSTSNTRLMQVLYHNNGQIWRRVLRDDTWNVWERTDVRRDSIWHIVYPVGAIYTSVVDTSPASLFGGTWEVWGSGRVPVGVNTAQTEFNTVERTGGHMQMQSHNHTTNDAGAGGLEPMFLAAPANLELIRSSGVMEASLTTQGGGLFGIGAAGVVFTGSGAINIAPHSHTVNSTGGGNAQNLQPYITCFMWRRVS